ncbi:hypothetical protein TREMEDRAFT_61903 [Tremella mesenterica DSM 1558]|uniref:uncharacterized protein n=1 Tax=Tremella mesenterica (strain ATCC 24925 / CBS 8224 / DSM 1558 / NBRC 9311 / NRRL Y-6157 / RJB 2259-6 / UBC 559-6) TaxID=578456 RepID=UPI0003F4973B|nr:uncharacterized protein TREMEDRAFT_61903 [Tremella mesenterica DSM 1558]EIW70142.1 hypothetical protein TREMEDRAFT_61903 [Tremella mesenterica DSM 1558]
MFHQFLFTLLTFNVLVNAHGAQKPLSSTPLHPQHAEHALSLLEKYPLIDTHIDLSATFRTIERNPWSAVHKLDLAYPGHIDLPRARAGGLAGGFFTANAPCPKAVGQDPGPDFLNPTDSIQHVLESMDLIRKWIEVFPDQMKRCRTASDVRQAFEEKKLAVMIGIEGTHQLSNSLAVMRMYAELGVGYVTLTHVCHSSFASSNGGGAGTSGSTIPPIHPGNGLTSLGVDLVRELNRLGVMVDLSHVSDDTARQAINVSRAPVIWSHSGARAVNNHPRNVPDDILDMIGDKSGQNRGIVLSVLYSIFIDKDNATLARVVDHIEHIASRCGKAHVGLGSDFNGIGSSVLGMEDVSKWPNMIQEFIHRGWTDDEIAGLMGGNLLRVMEEVEYIKNQLSSESASTTIYEKRKDLPAHEWGGPNMAYLADEVKEVVIAQKRLRDEL